MQFVAIDLFCGLGGWSDGLLAEGYNVVGFDVERHQYGDQRYPAQLVLQDVLTLHGSQFRNAALIVASPPCQAYSYMAMPWSRAKAIAAEYRSGVRSVDDLNALFNACFRIQREACEAAGRHVPMVVENVKGAQPWVGKAKAHYGSFYLWGDVDMVGDRIIAGGLRWESVRAAKRGAQKRNPDGTDHGQGSWFKIADSKNRGSENDGGSWFNIGSPGQTEVGQNPVCGRKVEGFNFHDYEKTGLPGRSFQSAAVDGMKVASQSDRRTDVGNGVRFTSRDCGVEGTKQGGNWWHDPESLTRKYSSKSPGRKAASAQIAKIPFQLASYIARAYRPWNVIAIDARNSQR